MAKLKDNSTVGGNVILHEGNIDLDNLATLNSPTGSNNSLVTFSNSTTSFTLVNHPTLPSLALSSNVSSVNEGNSVAFTLQATNIEDETSIGYTISGVSTADITPATLSGSFTVSSETATRTITLNEDYTTEGTEYLTLTLNDYPLSKAVTIGDTSLTPEGQVLYTSTGSHTFTVPDGVTSVSAFVVGGGGGSSGCPTIQGYSQSGPGAGGGSAYGSFSVTPGESLTVTVGAGGSAGTRGSTAAGDGGDGGTSSIYSGATMKLQATGGTGHEWQTTGWHSGGTGSVGSGVTGAGNSGGQAGGSNSNYAAGGGGAGGYTGNGGSGAYFGGDGTQGAGGGGGGGGGTSSSQSYNAGGGGGVGMLGQGSNGSRGTGATNGSGTGGGGGSGGTSASGRNAGSYGGGAGGSSVTGTTGTVGRSGAVRIIWGPNRAYPSTNTADV